MKTEQCIQQKITPQEIFLKNFKTRLYQLLEYKCEFFFASLILLALFFLNFCLIETSTEKIPNIFGKSRDLLFSLIGLALALSVMKKTWITLGYLFFLSAIWLFPLFLSFGDLALTSTLVTKSSYFAINCALGILAFNSFLANKNFFFSALSFATTLIILSIPLTYLFHFCTTGTKLYADTILAIVQTNVTESWEYLCDNSGFGLLGFFVIGIVFVTTFFKVQNFLPKCSISAILILILSCIVIYKTNDNYILYPFSKSLEGMHEYKKFSKLSKERKESIVINNLYHKGEEGYFVFIIGESQSRDHMHAYGYKRPNTPWLSTCRNRDDFIFFTHAYSNHTHTVPTLSLSLTARNQYNSLPLEKSPSLIDMANAAEYETFWLSNQVKIGAYDTPISVIADQSRHQFWLNKHMGETCDTNAFDGALLEQLSKIKFSSSKNFVIIHIMGSHGSYSQRYPRQFNIFGSSQIDAYDNSILYTDSVVQGIYTFFSQKKGFKALVYMSDHADAVDKNLGHDSSRFDFDMTRIPLWIAFSPEYAKINPDKIRTLKQNSSTPFTNDLMFDLILGLMNINSTSFYKAEFDIGSDTFKLKPEQLKTLHGKKRITEDPNFSLSKTK